MRLFKWKWWEAIWGNIFCFDLIFNRYKLAIVLIRLRLQLQFGVFGVPTVAEIVAIGASVSHHLRLGCSVLHRVGILHQAGLVRTQIAVQDLVKKTQSFAWDYARVVIAVNGFLHDMIGGRLRRTLRSAPIIVVFGLGHFGLRLVVIVLSRWGAFSFELHVADLAPLLLARSNFILLCFAVIFVPVQGFPIFCLIGYQNGWRDGDGRDKLLTLPFLAQGRVGEGRSRLRSILTPHQLIVLVRNRRLRHFALQWSGHETVLLLLETDKLPRIETWQFLHLFDAAGVSRIHLLQVLVLIDVKRNVQALAGLESCLIAHHWLILTMGHFPWVFGILLANLTPNDHFHAVLDEPIRIGEFLLFDLDHLGTFLVDGQEVEAVLYAHVHLLVLLFGSMVQLHLAQFITSSFIGAFLSVHGGWFVALSYDSQLNEARQQQRWSELGEVSDLLPWKV